MMVYFLKGRLPWQGFKTKKVEEKFQQILEKKLSININELCSDLPIQIANYLEYCRRLEFSETPDYDFLYNLLKDIEKKINPDPNTSYDFDWNNSDLIKSNEIRSPEKENVSNFNRSINKTGMIVLNFSENETKKNIHSPNVSDLQKNNTINESLHKKATLISGGVKRKNTGVSS
jgi:hypothetical protein